MSKPADNSWESGLFGTIDMIKPPTPVDELLRLETLRNLKILDTESEERFDRVTRLAKRVFGTPIALVSLVDTERQWFKSRQGLDAQETPRDISFCGHAILNDEILVVDDTHTDERFCDNPLVTADPNIRFYAGYPLSAPNGSKVGTLCIIDREPRALDDEDRDMLGELGRMVEEELAVADMMRDDPVTGLSNREGFAQIAGHILAMCERTKAAVCIVLVRFANQHIIENLAGKEEADRSAIELTHILMSTFRNSDLVGRVSEDTYAVLLAGSRISDVQAACDRLNDRVAERNDTCSNCDEIEIVAGAVEYRPDVHTDVVSLIAEMESHLEQAGNGEEIDYG